MGGYNSGGHNRRLVTVEACTRLDAGMLRRMGMFDGKPKGVQWTYSHGDRHTCDVQAYTDGQHSQIGLWIVRNGITYRQTIRTSETPCNYGKLRTWLHCPQCGRRVFRLYYYDNTYCNGARIHIFTCRQCQHLTYQARRERGFDLYSDRAYKTARKMGGATNGWRDDPPDKPKGMHSRTYMRLLGKWETATNLAMADWLRGVARIMPELRPLIEGM